VPTVEVVGQGEGQAINVDLTGTATPDATVAAEVTDTPTLPAAETPIPTDWPDEPAENGGFLWWIPTVVVIGGGAAVAVLTPRLGRRKRR